VISFNGTSKSYDDSLIPHSRSRGPVNSRRIPDSSNPIPAKRNQIPHNDNAIPLNDTKSSEISLFFAVISAKEQRITGSKSLKKREIRGAAADFRNFPVKDAKTGS